MATIAIDASRASRSNKTGVEWYSYFLIKELLRLPSEHKFLLYSNKSLPKEIFADAQAQYQEKVLFWPFKYLWTILRMSFQIILDRPDLLFIPSHNFPLILPKKTVITWHDIGYRRWPMYYSWLQKLSLRMGESRLSKASQIITVSNFSKQEMIDELKLDGDKIKVVPLAVDDNLFYPRPIDVQEKLLFKFNIKKPFLMFVGRLEEKKNVLKIIKAFNLFINKTKSDCRLVLIGNPGFGYDKIINLINHSEYKQQIIKLGWLSTDQLAIFYCASEGLVFTTNYEGFGVPVLEAHACGKRVIISRDTAAAELADEDDLLVDENSETAIANAMINLLNDNKDINLQHKNLYSWAETAKKTLSIINNTLK